MVRTSWDLLSLSRTASTLSAPVTLPTNARTPLPRERVERAPACAYSLSAHRRASAAHGEIQITHLLAGTRNTSYALRGATYP
jgi:hypothetical protein